MMEDDNQKKKEKESICIKLPFFLPNLEQCSKYITCSVREAIEREEENIEIYKQMIITRRNLSHQLHEVVIGQYRHKETGQVIERIEKSERITKCYDFLKMIDFKLPPHNKDNHSIDELNDLLRDKILNGNTLTQFKFKVAPENFMRPYNFTLPTTDLLDNRIHKKNGEKYKSQSISYGDKIPAPINQPQTKSELYMRIKKYFELRPCWLKNTLEYFLRQDGFKEKYSIYDLKNILKYISYTFKDGPWKHTFCRLGYDPTQSVESVKYQIIQLKIRQKGIEDYNEESLVEESQDAIYDPTFQQLPSKFISSYQLCDINDEHIRESLKGVLISSKSCKKQLGWFDKKEYLELHRIVKLIKQKIQLNQK